MSSMAMSMVNPTYNATPATSSTASAGSTVASSANATDASEGITSADFLTLLVTEMKNQDPTQPTDPNAYIQQLVGVNSLQQLISINQDLSDVGTSTTPTGSVSTPSVGSVSAS